MALPAPADPGTSFRNRILSGLAPNSLAQLRPRLVPAELALRQSLVQPEQRQAHVWFPETCMISILAHLGDGSGVEVGLIGAEGMVGSVLLLGDLPSEFEGLVQMEGLAWVLTAADFQQALAQDPGFRDRIARYALAFHRQVARTAVCNSRHQTRQRMVRWLLTAHDRAPGDSFPMTHEFLGLMLGVRRAGITVVAGELQKAGLVRFERGSVTILNRRRLEGLSCECHALIRESYERLLAPQER